MDQCDTIKSSKHACGLRLRLGGGGDGHSFPLKTLLLLIIDCTLTEPPPFNSYIFSSPEPLAHGELL